MTTNGEHVVLNTKLGKIRGNVVQSNGKRVAQFLGIPYAQQPVGKLRFQVLQALDSRLDSDGVPFDATKPGKAAVQHTGSFLAAHSETGEDCITLSVYVPLTGDEIELENGDLSVNKLPVFMHIHCGGFLIGSGSESYNDLTRFSGNHQAVGVNFNYRLNLFGFLSYPPWIEHNLGLKDQQFALKWVNENIADFGGDPDNVTIFGCSAGGASVHYHMMSHESSQYFSRGIAISGLINKVRCMEPQDRQRSKVEKTLRKLGCPSHYSGEQVRDFLVNLPSEKFSQFLGKISLDHELRFVPVDVFQCSEPTKKNILLKPLILGICAEEGKFFPDMLFPRKDNSMPTKARHLAADLLGEEFFFNPLRNTLAQLSQIPDFPVFVYLFDYNCTSRGEIYPEAEIPLHCDKCHTMDLIFALNLISKEGNFLQGTEVDEKVVATFKEIIQPFIHGDIDRIPLSKYESSNETINRISEDGISPVNKQCLLPKRKFLTPLGKGSLMLIERFPNSF